uniref:homeodomain-interacting protein kinase 2-like n=1 Tax=Scatophagus argus TaxID=75038 RepID=UPI001ED84F85|nr:homeodomain-interacting protein kinase 2-like [Scatophagus argus]
MAENINFKPKDILYNDSTKYQIKKFLGQGTFGKVAKCRKLSTREVMAVKITRRDLSSYGRREEAILTALKKLEPDKHNLLKILDSFNYMGHICMVFEMFDISLEDLVNITSPLQLSEIRVMAQQMLVALNALKSIPMVHANIKPDNIMLVNHKMQPFKLKMINFGFAERVVALRTGCKIQKNGYRAPEVILGLPLGEAIDMWGLGCVLAFLYLGKHLYPLYSEYEVMRVIMQMNGQPEDHLLNVGIYSKKYFIKDKDSPDSPWRFKTVAEYKLTKRWAITPRSSDSDTFNSFDDLARPVKKTTNEYEDTRAFLSLLRRMLHVDPEKRITPSEALGHRFITMKHLSCDTNDDMYVKSVCQTIKNCQLETSSVEFEPFVTSSEEISWHGPSPNSSDSSISTNKETAEDTDNGPQCTAAEKIDRTTATDDMDKTSNPEADKKPPGTNEAAPPVSLLSERGKTSNPGADKKPPGTNEAAPPASLLREEETGFVEVKSRRKWFKRIRKFFTRMFKSFDCCTETTVKLLTLLQR